MTAANILLFMALCMSVGGVSMIGASIALQNSIRKKKRICAMPVKAVIAEMESCSFQAIAKSVTTAEKKLKKLLE